jgi:DNA-binding IclR family transcriptional regulator
MVERGQGIEVVSRVGDLLRGLGTHEPSGVSTTDLARDVSMARPTAHRLLTSLAREGLVDRDSRTGRWHLGPELYLLGASAAARYDIGRHARPIVHDLAQSTGESAFLSARRGDETVCLLSEDGSFPLRSHVLREGIRFPLGVASAGLAILAHLPERELQAFLADADLVPEWGEAHARAALADRVDETRTVGYATNPGLVVEGSWGMGAAVFDRSGSPAWALSLTGVESRFRAERRPELGRLLLDRAHRLTQLLR